MRSFPAHRIAAIGVLTGLALTARAEAALETNNPAGTGPIVNRNAASEHLNLIWSPIPKANLGVEYLHASRTVENRQSGRLNRLQPSAQYFS